MSLSMGVSQNQDRSAHRIMLSPTSSAEPVLSVVAGALCVQMLIVEVPVSCVGCHLFGVALFVVVCGWEIRDLRA